MQTPNTAPGSDRANVDLHAMDRQYLLHPATHLAQHDENGPQIITAASGCHLTDDQGKRLLDAVGGLWCVNVGYGREELADAMAEQARKLAYFHLFSSQSNEPSIRLGEKLIDMANAGLDTPHFSKVIYGQSGSDANDTLMKIIWSYNFFKGRPNKRKILSRHQAYHGVTVASGSLTGLPAFHKIFGLPLDEVKHLSCPHYYTQGKPGESEAAFVQRMADEMEAMIQAEGPDTVAAFFMEPIMGAGGVIVPPKGYHQAMIEVCRRHDILVVSDEVICGFGRLGRDFGYQYFDYQPDMIAVAKGITSGYFPLSGSIISEEMWQTLLEGSRQHGVFAHGYTYSGHPIGAATALANLAIFERDGLTAHADRVGNIFQAAMREAVADHPHVGEVRGEKLIMAVQLVEDKAKKVFFDKALGLPAKVCAAARELGLICRPLPTGDAIAFSPPLVITEEECRWVAATFKQALTQVLG